MRELTFTYTLEPTEAQMILDGWDSVQRAAAFWAVDNGTNTAEADSQAVLGSMMQALRNALVDHLIAWAQEAGTE